MVLENFFSLPWHEIAVIGSYSGGAGVISGSTVVYYGGDKLRPYVAELERRFIEPARRIRAENAAVFEAERILRDDRGIDDT